jgi:hypothetical protein
LILCQISLLSLVMMEILVLLMMFVRVVFVRVFQGIVLFLAELVDFVIMELEHALVILVRFSAR